MTAKEIKVLITKFFDYRYSYLDRIKPKFRLDILIGKRVVYSGLYLFLEDNSLYGKIKIDIEFFCLVKLQDSNLLLENRKYFPKNIDNLVGFEEVEKLIFNYLLDFKRRVDEELESIGCMRYTDMYIYPGDLEHLIPIEDDNEN